MYFLGMVIGDIVDADIRATEEPEASRVVPELAILLFRNEDDGVLEDSGLFG